MIDDLDRSLERLLRARVPLPADQYLVSFDLPSSEWMKALPSGRRTVNLYLYDVRENHALRGTEWRHEARPDGGIVRRRPPVRMDLFYAVSTWSTSTPPSTSDEHRLLGQVLRTLLRYPTLPADLLEGSLAGQQPPLPALVAQPDTVRNPWELWSALGNRVRPALHLVVTVALDPAADPEPPVVLPPAVSRRVEVGSGVRAVVRVRVSPPLAAPLPAGTELRAGRVAAAAAAHLAAPLFNSALAVTVEEARTLRPNEWYLLDGGAASDVFRLAAAPGAGAATLSPSPPLRRAHPAGRTVRALSLSASLTALAKAAAAGAGELVLESGAGIGDGEWLVLEDGARTELARTAAHPAGAARVPVDGPLRGPHPAGTPVRRATPGAEEARLRDPAHQGATALELTSRAPLDAGVLAAGMPVLLGAGGGADLVVLGAAQPAPSTTVAVAPAPAGNHPAGTALRRVEEGAPAGRLAADAPAGATELLVAGEEAAVPGVGAPLRAGAAWHRVEARARDTAAAASEAFHQVVGRVVADAPGTPPVEGAEVVVRDPWRTTVSAADGHFAFTGLAAGSYTLQASAPGFAALSRTVAVPARTADEYTLALSAA